MKKNLTLQIFVAVLLAFLVSAFIPSFAVHFKLGGEIFLRILKMLIVPLVMTSVTSGILRMGNIKELGKPGVFTVFFYLASTLSAVCVGIFLVNLIQPGVGVDHSTMEIHSPITKELSIGTIVENIILMLFTDNIFKSISDGDILPLIAFSILFSGILTIMGEKAKTLSKLVVEANDVFMRIVLLIMKISPLGIFCLVTARFGKVQLEGGFTEAVSQTGYYFLTVLSGLCIHAFIVLPLFLMLFTRRKNIITFISGMSEALLTSFSTASSSATLPVTIKCAEKNLKISKKSVNFVLPLGSTMNMDGTALYEAVAAIFIAQMLGYELSLSQQIVIALTSTIAAIGAAGIPEAGLVTMVIVLNSVGLPTEYIGVILSIDWLLDRFRTSVNVFGDSIGAAVLERHFIKNE